MMQRSLLLLLTHGHWFGPGLAPDVMTGLTRPVLLAATLLTILKVVAAVAVLALLLILMLPILSGISAMIRKLTRR
jgi:hypothetical protein